jgi:hypothetical protein
MVMTLEQRGYITRQAGRARTIRLLIDPSTLPLLA